MQIPTSLKVGAHTYKVVLTDREEDLDGATGCMSDDEATIWIDKRCPRSVQESTLIHEILHCMNSTLGESEFGHALIDSLSEQFYQVLTENNLLK